jgi:hypothetical protein
MSENPWLTFALFVGICFSVAAIGSVRHRDQSGRGMCAALPGSNLSDSRASFTGGCCTPSTCWFSEAWCERLRASLKTVFDYRQRRFRGLSFRTAFQEFWA